VFYFLAWNFKINFAEKISIIEQQKKELAKTGTKESEDCSNCLLQKSIQR
jgi:hypothetical protein